VLENIKLSYNFVLTIVVSSYVVFLTTAIVSNLLILTLVMLKL
jgi:hypothetical protein